MLPAPAATGLAWGALGVLAFSLSLPTTQVAVRDLGPVLASFGRALVAAALAAGYLLMRRAARPTRSHLPGLLVVVGGVVIGFPLCTSLALRTESSAHSAVIVGLLPAATAVWSVLRGGERPSAAFWCACAAGAVAVTVFAVARGSGLPSTGDGFTVLAVLAAAGGYAEGARLAPELGADRVICWALLLSLPVVLPVTALSVVTTPPSANGSAWACFAYTAGISMFLGFFAWYRGLSLGGVAKVSQLQLAQPLLTVVESAVLFGEPVGPPVVIAAVAVLVCVAMAQRSRVGGGPPRPAPPPQPS